MLTVVWCLLFICECSLWFGESLLFMCEQSLWFAVSLLFICKRSLWFGVFTVHVWMFTVVCCIFTVHVWPFAVVWCVCFYVRMLTVVCCLYCSCVNTHVFTVHVWILMSLLFMCECSLWFAVFLLFIWKCSLLFGLNRWTWSRMHWLHLQAQTSLWNHSLSLKVRRCMHTHYHLSFIQVMHLPVTKLKGHFFTLRAQAYWS